MHEMALCESILQLVEENATTQGYSKVKKVWLEIGALSGVELEAMRFCFEAVKQDSLAAQSELHIVELPGRAWCLECGKEVTVQRLYDACPVCGSYQLQVTGGQEMRVKELEVE